MVVTPLDSLSFLAELNQQRPPACALTGKMPVLPYAI
jgi:hypothetical protein